MTHSIKHHLDDATLIAYASGTLPEAFNLIAATHISLCDTCRANAHAYDAVGGVLLEESRTPMTEGSLAHALARLGDEVTPTLQIVQHTVTSDLPEPLRNYIGGDLDSVKWRPVGMGVKQAILSTSKGASARLLSIPAGAAMPDHGHNGKELTLVLKGAFQDADEYFARGDVEVAGKDVQHIPVADIHEDCICLAVTDAPLRFEGFLPRILQKFVRI
ncbi:ChrR family anti-sigma-E factor [Sulfitobacter guttiformis]|uniref:ChrR-like anti-ECFsigma factor n=1 Tax=Sulfitobacter guttiformis TaxID=74349 RepID=A0A420DSY4_9RHOB|nr:ChrR family anti-sigma-E factor [Sulfitobacter guttiformis]KIN74780.1 Anti-sigma factor ChrR [Sulfitobacter guttiformis KCTC 32187]RKE97352.1 ChrR-like anti-ECFsigma factor [Sulfitobacter guttiformis]